MEGKEEQKNTDGGASNINDDFGKDIEEMSTPVDEIISDDSATNEDSADEDICDKLEQFKIAGGFDDFDATLTDLFGAAGELDDLEYASNNSNQSTDESIENETTLSDEIIADCLKNPDSIDEDGNNVIHKLVKIGDGGGFDNFCSHINKLHSSNGKEFVKQKLKHQNNIGNTPLLELLRCEDMNCCNMEALKIFLHKDYEYDINISNNMKLSPLHIIMSKEFLPNIYKNVSSAMDHEILDNYNKERNKIAKMLLKAGAQVNQKDIFNLTPLFSTNATSSVQLLIKNGADLNITDTFGRSVLLAAVSMENHKCLTQYYMKAMDTEKILKPDVYKSTLFHYVAILQRELDICDYLECKFDKGDYLECTDRNGKTPHDVSRFKLQSEIKRKPIRSLLKKRGIGAPWDNTESEFIKQTVIKFAEDLCKAIGEKDKRLKCTLQRSGSSEEGTKIGDPNEFDFIFCIDEIQKLCSVHDVNTEKEFVELKADKDIPRPFAVFFDKRGRCKISEVRLAFSRVVKTIVFDEQIWKSKDIVFGKLENSEESDKPVLTLEIRWFGCAYKDEIISIDLVPAIRKTEWWPTKGGSCELLEESIKEKGCFLLFQTKFFVQSDTLMRISCSPAETELIKYVLPPYFLEGYRQCKLIYLWLINTDSSNKYIQKCIENKLLTSYMFKNCLFYVFENYKKKEKPVTPENYEEAVVELVGDILSCLQSFNKKRTFPVYFIPEREDIFVIKPLEQYNLRMELKDTMAHQCEIREHVIMYMQKKHSEEKL